MEANSLNLEKVSLEKVSQNKSKLQLEKKEQNMAVSHVSLFFGSGAAGSLTFSYLGGLALQIFNRSHALILMGCFPLILFFYVLMIYEEKKISGEPEDSFDKQIEQIIHSQIEEHYSKIELQNAHIKQNKNLKLYQISSAKQKSNQILQNIFEKKKEKKIDLNKNEKNEVSFSNKIESDKNSKISDSSKNNFIFNKNSYVEIDSNLKNSSSFNNSFDSQEIILKQPKGFLYSTRRIFIVIRHPKIMRIMIIVVSVLLIPSFSSTWRYYFTNVLKLSPQDLGDLTFMSSCGYLIGIIAMNTFFKGVKLKGFYRSTTIISSILLSTGLFLLFDWYKALHIAPMLFCAMNSVVSNFVSEINILPILALCCRFCPKGLEAMSYAFFMSISWVGVILSQLFGAIILYFFDVSQNNFSNFWKCIIFQTSFGIFVAIVISFIYFPENFNDVSEFIKSNYFIYLFIK